MTRCARFRDRNLPLPGLIRDAFQHRARGLPPPRTICLRELQTTARRGAQSAEADVQRDRPLEREVELAQCLIGGGLQCAHATVRVREMRPRSGVVSEDDPPLRPRTEAQVLRLLDLT